jgi:hypothetical protein
MNDVIPGLVHGIHLSACSAVRGWLDPGDKHRDDTAVRAGSMVCQGKDQTT